MQKRRMPQAVFISNRQPSALFATLQPHRDRIAIVTKAGVTVHHPRVDGLRAASILPEHRAAMVEAVHGSRAKLYYQRQNL